MIFIFCDKDFFKLNVKMWRHTYFVCIRCHFSCGHETYFDKRLAHGEMNTNIKVIAHCDWKRLFNMVEYRFLERLMVSWSSWDATICSRLICKKFFLMINLINVLIVFYTMLSNNFQLAFNFSWSSWDATICSRLIC